MRIPYNFPGSLRAALLFLVEDHPVMRRGLAAWFAETGRWNVLGAAAGLDEAKALLSESSPPDIIVLDIQLGRQELGCHAWGLGLVPWLREKFGKAAPACVVYSAFTDTAHVGAAFKQGVRGYVGKDADEAALEKALLSVLAGGEYMDPSLAAERLTRVTGFEERLTRREAEVFNLAKARLSSREIGARLGISSRTVDNILSCIFDKTGIANRKELGKL
ncbi:DNA-binding response regulator [Spirochaetia bacterium]|nr:DNA-binding response regulator [Spirochaetia bacterium]